MNHVKPWAVALFQVTLVTQTGAYVVGGCTHSIFASPFPKAWEEMLFWLLALQRCEVAGWQILGMASLEYSLALSYHFPWLGSSLHALLVLENTVCWVCGSGLESPGMTGRLSRSMQSVGLLGTLQTFPISWDWVTPMMLIASLWPVQPSENLHKNIKAPSSFGVRDSASLGGTSPSFWEPSGHRIQEEGMFYLMRPAGSYVKSLPFLLPLLSSTFQ